MMDDSDSWHVVEENMEKACGGKVRALPFGIAEL